mmetsp:Transcript_5904/g.18498  ORF Transcript_5904/g.18498 Transcript_5904/m.18498 type:complete len:80 (+) Transcript_5904:2286-2525(+)
MPPPELEAEHNLPEVDSDSDDDSVSLSEGEAEATPAQAAKARHEDKPEVEQEPELQPNYDGMMPRQDTSQTIVSQRKAT